MLKLEDEPVDLENATFSSTYVLTFPEVYASDSIFPTENASLFELPAATVAEDGPTRTD